ncbi:hypothetical protein C8R47DRAFT_1277939 [Mycena vitilis]|nr:hypothetical protein C8R47DRAFT_1277939 [Mycena vitilis]
MVLPWLQLTTFDGNVSTLDLFTLAPNLVEVSCDFDSDNHLPSVATTHLRLNSLTLRNGSLDILQYLTLPALKHLDLDELAYEGYHSLEPFLMRSSPPLLSLSVRADDDDCYQHWRRCLLLVASTLEKLEVSQPTPEVMIDLCHSGRSCSLYKLPNLRAASFEGVSDNLDPSFLIYFLYSQLDKLRSFRLVWIYDGGIDIADPRDPNTVDTFAGHLSRISRSGMDLYVGTKDKNYAASTPALLNRFCVSYYKLYLYPRTSLAAFQSWRICIHVASTAAHPQALCALPSSPWTTYARSAASPRLRASLASATAAPATSVCTHHLPAPSGPPPNRQMCFYRVTRLLPLYFGTRAAVASPPTPASLERRETLVVKTPLKMRLFSHRKTKETDMRPPGVRPPVVGAVEGSPLPEQWDLLSRRSSGRSHRFG